MPNYNYVNCPGPGDFLPEDDPNDDILEADIDQLHRMLSHCTLDPEDLIGVPAWKRLRWSIAIDYRAKLIRSRISTLTCNTPYCTFDETCEACQ